MRYWGHQFRAARGATGLDVRTICEGAALSPHTLKRIESAELIEYGVRAAGRFEEATVAKLVELYEDSGVTFLEQRGVDGSGLRYQPRKQSWG